ncbi:MAG: hypothetical protein ACPGLV_15220, partial [Bacteroidia bacterium]
DTESEDHMPIQQFQAIDMSEQLNTKSLPSVDHEEFDNKLWQLAFGTQSRSYFVELSPIKILNRHIFKPKSLLVFLLLNFKNLLFLVDKNNYE